MLRFLLTRAGLLIPTFVGVTLLTFTLVRLAPGDPVLLLAGERGIDAERYARLRAELHLDRPLLVQYAIYMRDVVAGDLGKSVVTREPVAREFAQLFPATIELSFAASASRWCSACRPASWRRCGAAARSTTASWGWR